MFERYAHAEYKYVKVKKDGHITEWEPAGNR